MDTIASKFVMKFVVPLCPPQKVIDILYNAQLGGTHIKALPVRQRPHSELWDDEKEANSVNWKRLGYVISATVATLAVFATQTQQFATIPKMLLSLQSKA